MRYYYCADCASDSVNPTISTTTESLTGLSTAFPLKKPAFSPSTDFSGEQTTTPFSSTTAAPTTVPRRSTAFPIKKSPLSTSTESATTTETPKKDRPFISTINPDKATFPTINPVNAFPIEKAEFPTISSAAPTTLPRRSTAFPIKKSPLSTSTETAATSETPKKDWPFISTVDKATFPTIASVTSTAFPIQKSPSTETATTTEIPNEKVRTVISTINPFTTPLRAPNNSTDFINEMKWKYLDPSYEGTLNITDSTSSAAHKKTLIIYLTFIYNFFFKSTTLFSNVIKISILLGFLKTIEFNKIIFVKL